MRFVRSAVFVAALIIMCLVGVTRSSAQATCYACPDNSSEQTVNVNVCIGSTTYNLNVTYCTKVYSPPSAAAPCSNFSNRADAATSIRKICPGSSALPTDLEKTIRAVYCAFSPAGQNIFGISIPNCGTNVYCWTIRTPKCWQISQSCFVPCDDSRCCSMQWQFCKNPVTGAIQCVVSVGPCDTPGDCPQGCTQINCDNLDLCNCPSCF